MRYDLDKLKEDQSKVELKWHGESETFINFEHKDGNSKEKIEPGDTFNVVMSQAKELLKYSYKYTLAGDDLVNPYGEPTEEQEPEEEVEERDLEMKDRAELEKMLDDRGLSYNPTAKPKELAEIIKEHEQEDKEGKNSTKSSKESERGSESGEKSEDGVNQEGDDEKNQKKEEESSEAASKKQDQLTYEEIAEKNVDELKDYVKKHDDIDQDKLLEVEKNNEDRKSVKSFLKE